MTDQYRATLFVDPPSHHFLGDRLFDPNAAPFGGDQLMAPYAHLKKVLADRGVRATTIDALPEGPVPGRNLYISVGSLERYRSLMRRGDLAMSAFFAFECPGNDPAMYRGMQAASRVFRRMYSWSDSESLRPFIGAEIPLHRFCWPQSFNRVHEDLWSKRNRRFLVMMQGNKMPALAWGSLHRERLKAVEYFGRTGEIDLYGREWDQPAYRVGRSRAPYTFRVVERRLRALWQLVRPDPLLKAACRAWRGPAVSKSQTLADYTFAICFENMVLKGWITEKVFDCFFAGTIPVYWGAPEIREVIPPDCFIDMREFDGYQALGDHLRSLTDARIQQHREAARAFLGSPAFTPFTKESFAALVSRIVVEDAV